MTSDYHLIFSVASLCFGMSKTTCLPLPMVAEGENPVGLISNLKQEVMNQNRKKGGRPKKELGAKKDYRINTKLETKEYYSLLAKVKKAGSTISEFVRSAINNGYIKERLSMEQADYIRKLSGMANNLNQLAYQANVQGYSSIANRCNLLSDEIDATIKMLKT